MDDKYAREVALEILAEDGLFDPGHHRLIEGIAATAIRDKNGVTLDPAGVLFTLPVPLLWSHDWLRPIGRVTRGPIRVKRDGRLLDAQPLHAKNAPASIYAVADKKNPAEAAVAAATSFAFIPAAR